MGNTIRKGLEEFREDVENKSFPSQEFSPYKVIIYVAVLFILDQSVQSTIVEMFIDDEIFVDVRSRNREMDSNDKFKICKRV